MSAELEKLSVPRRYRAWCEVCQDGYQGAKATCVKWMEKHNAARHSKEQDK